MRQNRRPQRARRFSVSGIVVERESGRALPGLIVRTFDRDLCFDDALGFALTGADGGFSIPFDASRFSDVREARPDVFLRIYDSRGERLLHETDVRENAALHERMRIVLPAAGRGQRTALSAAPRLRSDGNA